MQLAEYFRELGLTTAEEKRADIQEISQELGVNTTKGRQTGIQHISREGLIDNLFDLCANGKSQDDLNALKWAGKQYSEFLGTPLHALTNTQGKTLLQVAKNPDIIDYLQHTLKEEFTQNAEVKRTNIELDRSGNLIQRAKKPVDTIPSAKLGTTRKRDTGA